jgi:hypothetical protein
MTEKSNLVKVVREAGRWLKAPLNSIQAKFSPELPRGTG